MSGNAIASKMLANFLSSIPYTFLRIECVHPEA